MTGDKFEIVKGSELPIISNLNRATFLGYEDKNGVLESGRIDFASLVPLFGVTSQKGQSTTLAISQKTFTDEIGNRIVNGQNEGTVNITTGEDINLLGNAVHIDGDDSVNIKSTGSGICLTTGNSGKIDFYDGYFDLYTSDAIYARSPDIEVDAYYNLRADVGEKVDIISPKVNINSDDSVRINTGEHGNISLNTGWGGTVDLYAGLELRLISENNIRMAGYQASFNVDLLDINAYEFTIDSVEAVTLNGNVVHIDGDDSVYIKSTGSGICLTTGDRGKVDIYDGYVDISVEDVIYTRSAELDIRASSVIDIYSGDRITTQTSEFTVDVGNISASINNGILKLGTDNAGFFLADGGIYGKQIEMFAGRTKINIHEDKVYYSPNSVSLTADRELAVKGDITSLRNELVAAGVLSV